MAGEKDLYRDKIEVSLDGRQVFYLFFGGAVIASLVFVLGVMIGKRLESRAHAVRSATAELAHADPLAALDLLASNNGTDNLSFASALRKAEPDTLDAVVVPNRIASANRTEKEKHERQRAEEKKMTARQTLLEEKKAKERKRLAAEKIKKELEAKKLAAKKTADAKSARKIAGQKSKASAGKKTAKFTLQLSSFRSEDEAEVFYEQLRSSGYRPYISRAEVPGKGTWFRVRVGKYPSFDSALEAKARFEKKQKIIAYVTRL